ncbi:hypothetical protein Nepgr_017764 [Nepenthes gracilis]|uniref:Uncharacterized protein n=1 Tax=Nepenthes gracilis TaxID=150966 RepID=A0AAD3SR36_NEPGR|nr:hypothetical protein Nepgr_017764 [Nepenthes gracilis]
MARERGGKAKALARRWDCSYVYKTAVTGRAPGSELKTFSVHSQEYGLSSTMGSRSKLMMPSRKVQRPEKRSVTVAIKKGDRKKGRRMVQPMKGTVLRKL